MSASSAPMPGCTRSRKDKCPGSAVPVSSFLRCDSTMSRRKPESTDQDRHRRGGDAGTKGASELLRESQPVIITEFAPPGLRTVSDVSGEEYLRFVAALGYRDFAVIQPDGRRSHAVTTQRQWLTPGRRPHGTISTCS